MSELNPASILSILTGKSISICSLQNTVGIKERKQHNNFITRKGTIGRYGAFECDTPAITLASAWSQVSATTNTPAPDFILWTGDHVSVRDPIVNQEATIWYLENISAALHMVAKSFLPQKQVRVFPTLGNHDSFPAYQSVSSSLSPLFCFILFGSPQLNGSSNQQVPLLWSILGV